MLQRITGRAVKCGPSAISAIAGVPTHRPPPSYAACSTATRSTTSSWTSSRPRLGSSAGHPDHALRHPKFRDRRYARSEDVWACIFANVPFDLRAMTLGTMLDAAPPGTWAISAGNHFVAWSDGHVADSGAWFSRKPARWSRANPDHDRVARRRIREAVRFVPIASEGC